MHILLADDHDLFLDGVRILLQQLGEVVISEARNSEEIESAMGQEGQPDILLLDLGMPGIESVEQVKAICTVYPKVAVVIVSGNDALHVIEACRQAGVAGFIPKSVTTEVLLSAVRIIYAGDKYFPAKLFNIDKPFSFSRRQKEIYNLIVEGNSNKEIADVLDIAESTVKQHITELFRKLQVTSRFQAIQKASNLKL